MSGQASQYSPGRPNDLHLFVIQLVGFIYFNIYASLQGTYSPSRKMPIFSVCRMAVGQ